MNKTDFIDKVVTKTGCAKKDVEAVVAAYQEVVKETLSAGDKVSFVGFGSFEVTERAAREGRNPATGESILIGSSKTPKFKASKNLKDAVNAK